MFEKGPSSSYKEEKKRNGQIHTQRFKFFSEPPGLFQPIFICKSFLSEFVSYRMTEMHPPARKDTSYIVVIYYSGLKITLQ